MDHKALLNDPDLLQRPAHAVRKYQLQGRFNPHFVRQLQSTTPAPIYRNESNETYTLITPKGTTKEPLVVCIGGFSQGIDAYADELYDLYRAGYRCLYMNPIQGERAALYASHKTFQEKYHVPKVVMRKVVAVAKTLGEISPESFHLIGHSQGGMIATHVAAYMPERCHSLTIVSPEGFQSEQTPLWIATKFAYQATDQAFDVSKRLLQGEREMIEPSSRAGRTFMRHFFQKTLWRFLREIPAGISVDLRPLLLDLKQTPVHVTLLNAHSDRLFTTDEYETALRTAGSDSEDGEDPFVLVDQWTMFARKGAGHTALGIELPGVLRQIIETH